MGKDKETNVEPVDPPDREEADVEVEAPETAPVDPPDHQGGGGRG